MLLAQAGNHRRAGGDGVIIIDYAPERKPVSKRHLRVTLPIRPVGRRPQQCSRPYIEPEEARNERRTWTSEDLARRPDRLDAPPVHDHHRLGERERLGLVMGHIDGGEAEPAPAAP